MVKKEMFKGKTLFICSACGFSYLKKETAQKCKAYCKKYHSCSLEITKHAVITNT